MIEYIDASVFLGMHSSDEKIRIACKNYFVKRLNNTVVMSLEQVGKCDDIIWKYSREEQDEYYPFMDYLHTVMDIQRVHYNEGDIKEAINNLDLQDLNISDRLTAAMGLNKGTKLYSINPNLTNKTFVHSPNTTEELSFPQELEKLYKQSLKLKISAKGIIPPLVTPLDRDGNVCEQSVKNLINFVKPYSTALMPTLSSGEGWALTDNQWKDMIKYTIKHSSGLPVFAGIEYKTTEEVVKKAKIAKKIGVDAIVVTTPFEKNISQDEIYKHFEKIKEIGISVFIYNEESISGNSIEYETIVKICELGNIIGIKEASGSAKFTQRLINSKIKVPVFQGWEHLCNKSKGVEGYILPLSNLDPKICLEMLKNPNFEKQNKIDDLCKRYNISGDDWFIFLKKELKQKEIITTEKVA